MHNEQMFIDYQHKATELRALYWDKTHLTGAWSLIKSVSNSMPSNYSTTAERRIEELYDALADLRLMIDILPLSVEKGALMAHYFPRSNPLRIDNPKRTREDLKTEQRMCAMSDEQNFIDHEAK